MSAAMGRPRLLTVTPDFPPAVGGIQQMSYMLAREMTGFETLVLAPQLEGGREFDSASAVAVRRVRARARAARARNVQLNLAELVEARRFRPEAILLMHVVASPAAIALRRATHTPVVQYFHAKEIPDKPRLSAFAASRADAVIAVSSYTASLIAGTGAVPACLRLIPPGVTLPHGSEAEQRGPPTVITIARLNDRYKGHDVLVSALARVRARVPDVRWVVVGDGPLRAELEALARASGVADATLFVGAVSNEERDRWLERAHLLAMPSRIPGPGQAGDGFGIVFLEAGARGKPVVAGNVGGAVDAVADGESGLLVDPRDPEAVAGAIARLLLDRELARRMGRAGAERARRLAWPRVARRVEELLIEQLARAADRQSEAGGARRARLVSR